METIEIVLLIGIGILFARGLGWLKGIPIKKQTALALALLVGVGGVVFYDWGGIRTGLTGVEIPGIPGVTPAPSAAIFEAVGSETDANLTYDSSLQLFTCAGYENWLGGKFVTPTALGTSITTLTLTITVYNVGGSAENIANNCTITSSTGTFLDDNGKVRSPVDKDAVLNEWKVAMTPTGGSARNEKNTMSVPSAGSKAMAIVATLDEIDANLLDNFQSTDVTFYVQGIAKPFTLRIIKTGVDTTPA